MNDLNDSNRRTLKSGGAGDIEVIIKKLVELDLYMTYKIYTCSSHVYFYKHCSNSKYSFLIFEMLHWLNSCSHEGPICKMIYFKDYILNTVVVDR